MDKVSEKKLKELLQNRELEKKKLRFGPILQRHTSAQTHTRGVHVSKKAMYASDYELMYVFEGLAAN